MFFEFCEHLDIEKEIFNYGSDGLHPHKKPTSPVPSTANPCWIAKGQTRPINPWKMAQKNITKDNSKPTCPLYGPENLMNSCKVTQE